ncbi:hypothetical protein [Devosia submarina]|uniref:hypothetical protein n=1 Tax=Devosia submarina TaxID=1173082 RepID=UPI000D3A246F|nr:hypothetical protein [Devosia submarina]
MRKARQELLRLIVMALQSGGIQGGEQRAFAREMGEREDFFAHHVTTYYENVSMDRLANLYDVAATRAGWMTLAEILRQYHDDVRDGRYLPPDLEREARRYVARVEHIAPYDQVLAAVWRAWPPRPRPTYSLDPDDEQ